MAHLNTCDLLRAGDVKRWIIVRTVVPQSLAEHTFNVVMIARAICKEMGVGDEAVIKYALEHDLDEIKTGDVPTPAKAMIEMPDHYNGNNEPERGVYNIVKVADSIEAYWFITENGVGRHAAGVRSYLETKIDTLMAGMSPELKGATEKVMTDVFTKEFAI